MFPATEIPTGSIPVIPGDVGNSRFPLPLCGRDLRGVEQSLSPAQLLLGLLPCREFAFRGLVRPLLFLLCLAVSSGLSRQGGYSLVVLLSAVASARDVPI